MTPVDEALHATEVGRRAGWAKYFALKKRLSNGVTHKCVHCGIDYKLWVEDDGLPWQGEWDEEQAAQVGKVMHSRAVESVRRDNRGTGWPT